MAKKIDNKDLIKYIKANGETFKLKAGIVTRLVTDSDHYYLINGKLVPGVTSILDAAAPFPFGLREFYKNHSRDEAETIFKTAGEFGTVMHAIFEQALDKGTLSLVGLPKKITDMGNKLNQLDKIKTSMTYFADWFVKYAPTEFESEQIVASKKFKYAGTLDFVGKINGEIWLIDFKTSNGIYYSHFLQVLAYKQAYEESYGVKIDHCAILRVGTAHKGTTVSKKDLPEIGLGWECREVPTHLKINSFMNVYKNFLDINGGKLPEPREIVVYPDEIVLFEKVKKEVK